MKTALCLLCAISLSFGLYAPAGTARQDLPDGRSRYVMDVTLDTQADRISERVSVTFENDSDTPWPEVCFCDFVPAVQEHAQPGAYTSAVLSVTDAGGAALEFVSDRQAGLLTVSLPQALEPGRCASLTIEYEADVPRAQGERFQAAAFPGSDGITYRLCQFYPMLCPWRDGAFVCHPYAFGGEAFFTECSDYELTLRLPEAFTVIASGREQCLSSEGGAAVWRIEAEDMRDLVVTASTEFAAPFTGQVNGVTVNSWGTPAQAAQAQTSLQIALDSIALFEERIGGYPYDELDVCVAYMPAAAGGIEYPGLIEIIQADLTGEDYLGTVVSHEVAHQWFYGVVGNDQYTEPFLDESFASYCELLYRQYVQGESAQSIAADMDDCAALYDQLGDDPIFRIDLGYGDYYASGDGSMPYYYAIYEFGRLFLWQVRQAMGDEAFFAMLSAWYEEQSFRTPTISQFLDHLTAASGGDPAVAALIDAYMTR